VVFPQFKLVKEDQDEEALRYAARQSSGLDLVEEFNACGVAFGARVGFGRDCTPSDANPGGQIGAKPSLSHGLVRAGCGRFRAEVESEDVKIVGKYVSKTEMLRSWDIHGSNMRLNRVFELNKLPYGPYPEGDSADAGDDRGKQVKPWADEGTSKEKAPVAATRKSKLGMGDDETGPRATGSFVEELMETCVVPEELMSSPKLRETSSRMLKVTEGRWPRNDPIPWAASDDFLHLV
jgi:hypothetical protein